MRGILDSADCEVDGHDFDTMGSVLRSRLLLGQQVGDPIAEDKIDRRAKFPQEDKIARQVVSAQGVAVLDLYANVTGECGDTYTDCFICRQSPCSYHYNSVEINEYAGRFRGLGNSRAAGALKRREAL